MNYIVKKTEVSYRTDYRWLLRKGYTKTARKVYSVLLKHTGSDYGNKTIAELSGISVRSLVRALQELEFAGLLTRVRVNATTMFIGVGVIQIPDWVSNKELEQECAKALKGFAYTKEYSLNNSGESVPRYNEVWSNKKVKEFIKNLGIKQPEPIGEIVIF